MGSTTIFLCVLSILAMASIANSQFGYRYRSWFGGSSVFDACLPNGQPCVRPTDCCSTYCVGYPDPPECFPHICGCPQPPWSDHPISDPCTQFPGQCNQDSDCCTGYCDFQFYQCASPPCKPC